jgi:hypothetical protein
VNFSRTVWITFHRRGMIRASRYRIGGQPVTTARMAEVKPRTQVPGLDAAFSPEPIAGGTTPPGPVDLVARMPDALRHRGAGPGLADLEALARDIDGDIVQVRADPAPDAAGRVRVTVLARGEGRAPVYSRVRRDNLARALTRAASDAWPESCIEVRSARIVPIRVTVALTARPGEGTRLSAQATERLRDVLHAALGGPDGRGWPIGRRPWPMDVERALAGTPGLDRVLSVGIAAADGTDLPPLARDEVAGLVSTDDLVLVTREATP